MFQPQVQKTVNFILKDSLYFSKKIILTFRDGTFQLKPKPTLKKFLLFFQKKILGMTAGQAVK